MVRSSVAIRSSMFWLLPLLCAITQAQTTVTLAPSHDAYVNDSAPANNFNTSNLVVGRSAAEFLPLYRTYIRFNFGAIPTSAVLTSAQLRLSLQAAEGSGTMAVEVRRALETWTATTIVWDTQPARGPAVATISLSPVVGSTAIFNLASLVQGWVSGLTANNGLVLQAADETTAGRTRTFASNNHPTTGLRPQLVVTYSLPADIAVSPLSLSFGNQILGGISATQTVTIQNAGGLNLTVSSIASSSAEFILEGIPPLPAVVAPGGSATFKAYFKPLTTGIKSDSILIASNDTDEAIVSVGCSGTGVGPQDDFPLTPEQMAFRFDRVPVNTLSATQAVVLRNPGTVTRTITDFRAGCSADSDRWNILNSVVLPAVIPAGGSLTLGDVQFAPTLARTSVDEIEITTNAPVNPTIRIRLEGRGIVPSAPDFYADPRAYRVEFDRLKYANGDPIWIRFSPASGHNPGSEATVYLVSPVQDDIERVTLRTSGPETQNYGQVNRIIASSAASSRFDGKLSAQPGEFFFLFYQGPDALPTVGGTNGDFAFLKGGAPQGLFSLASDSSLTPITRSVPGRPGETPRGLAAVARTSALSGIVGDDQIIIQPRDLTELNDFLHRYGGRVVDDGTRPGAGQFANRHFYLVRVNPDSADLSDFAFTAELAGVHGSLRSSESGKISQLFAILSNEQLESRRVSLNPRVQFFDRPSTTEAASLLPGGAGSDAFQLEYIRDCVQKVNRAWMYVAMHDRDRAAGTSVRLAIIDDGFCTNPDLPMVAGEGRDIARDDADPTGPRITDDGLDWHGASLASAAASLHNNGIGSAGSGGQVADLMFYRLGGTDFLFEVGTAIDLAVASDARVINMSFGVPCRLFGSPTFCNYEDFGYWINLLFVCPFIDVILETALAIVRPFLPVQPVFPCETLMAALTVARSRMAASIEDALAAGVSIVASAGNARDVPPIPPSDIADFEIIPASIGGVIAVGEMDNTYTNTQFYGDRVDVWSMDPVRAYVQPDGAADCGVAPVLRDLNGTSISAAFISGVVCMMRAVNPALTPAEIRSIFRSLPAGPADPTVQRALDAYAVVLEAGTRAGLY